MPATRCCSRRLPCQGESPLLKKSKAPWSHSLAHSKIAKACGEDELPSVSSVKTMPSGRQKLKLELSRMAKQLQLLAASLECCVGVETLSQPPWTLCGWAFCVAMQRIPLVSREQGVVADVAKLHRRGRLRKEASRASRMAARWQHWNWVRLEMAGDEVGLSSWDCLHVSL